MQADTTFDTNLLTFGHAAPKSADQPKCSFGCPGGSKPPNLVSNVTQTTQTASLSLIANKTSAPVVFLPVKFCDSAVSALIDSGATYNFLTTSLLLKLQD